ncbi:hypothetical protein HMPREF0889_0277 [Megasphaera lornae]|uniref:Uncharacterized protein n=1 Tax=Megasphaera lornae TaxID=1000568 RepID=D3LVF3_9FIRM|nr:hypothetical protein [Megasphaera genomosp. type_1]EFD93880.1 hypothetical protein HMPREF0889_0277 [Megasphaera genomosp. type_1 str. 28L]
MKIDITNYNKPSIFGTLPTMNDYFNNKNKIANMGKHVEQMQQARDNAVTQALETRQIHVRPQPIYDPNPQIWGNLHAQDNPNTANAIYRNLFCNGTNPTQANTYAPSLGVSPQFLMDNPDYMQQAKTQYDSAKKWEFLPPTITFGGAELDSEYPELSTYRKQNSVGATIALQNHQAVKDTRGIFAKLEDGIKNTGRLFENAFLSGLTSINKTDATLDLMKNNTRENYNRVVSLDKKAQEYQMARPHSFEGQAVYDTVQQLTMYGLQAMKASRQAIQGASLGMATVAPFALALAPETLGTGTLATLAAGATTGANIGFKTGLFKAFSDQATADRYWSMYNKKDKNGNPLYSQKNMQIDSTAIGTISGAINTGLFCFAVKPIASVFGTSAVTKLFNNAVARKKVIGAGRKAILAMVAKESAAQFGRNFIAQTAQEGAESVSNDMADNIEYSIHGQGNQYTPYDVMHNAVSAMINAVPSAVGLGVIGAGFHARGNYANLRALGHATFGDNGELYKRAIEKNAIQELIENKKTNELAKNNPDVFQKVVHEQAKNTGMDTMHVDTRELFKSEEGTKVVQDLIHKGVVTTDEVQHSIETGTDLEVNTGAFAQKIDDKFDVDTLMNATTLDENGKTVAQIKANEEQRNAIIKELSERAKGVNLSDEIINKHFADVSPQEQEFIRRAIENNSEDFTQGHAVLMEESQGNPVGERLAKKAGEYLDSIKDNHYELKQHLTDEGKEVFDATLDKLRHGNKKIKESAVQSAYLYAKMADRWAHVMNKSQKVKLDYTAKDFSNKNGILLEKGKDVKGLYDGFIHLFDKADESTFVHESAHAFLSGYKNIMEHATNLDEDTKNEYNELQDWLSYDPDKIKEYQGERAKEFKGYEKDIKTARKNGDKKAEKQALERWEQERFARGFERYLKEGKAPSISLKNIFRKFKDWLTGIYKDSKNIGAEVPEQVERFMDKMVATDKEIDTATRIQELATLTQDPKATALNEDIRAKAKETVFADMLQDEINLTEKEKQEEINQYVEETKRKLCAEDKRYSLENLANEYSHDKGILDMLLPQTGFNSWEEFYKSLDETDGRLDKRLEESRKFATKEVNGKHMTEEEIQEETEKALTKCGGQLQIVDEQLKTLDKELYSVVAKLADDTADMETQFKELINNKGVIGTIIRKNNSIKAIIKELDEKKTFNTELYGKAKAEIKAEIFNALTTEKMSVKEVTEHAREVLNAVSVSNSQKWRNYNNKGNQAVANATKYFNGGDVFGAIRELANAKLYFAMAKTATENFENIRIMLQGKKGVLDKNGNEIYGIKGMVKKISRKNAPKRMEPNARYFLQQAAYLLGITNEGGNPLKDENGEEIPLDWKTIAKSLDPEWGTEQNTAPNLDNVIEPELRAFIEGDKQIDYKKDLTLDEFTSMYQAMKAVYRTGGREYEGNTIFDRNGKKVSIQDAISRLIGTFELKEDYDAEQVERNKTFKDKIKDKSYDFMLDIVKPETLLRSMGSELWTDYIYKPLDVAGRKELEMNAKAMKEFSRIRKTYTFNEWRKIRNDRIYSMGTHTHYTKEEILVMALHWGSDTGRQRISDELQMGTDEVEKEFSKILNDKDVEFISSVWKQLEGYWGARNKVQERLTGVGMGRVKPMSYVINGHELKGGYYPIAYDSRFNATVKDQEMDDIAKLNMNYSAMSIGMKGTKNRVDKVYGKIVRKSLDLWADSIRESIHHITTREAVTDVYKILSDKELGARISQEIGVDAYRMLLKWSRDCWRTDIAKMNAFTRFLESQRKNVAFVTMAFRTNTAMLNATNVFPMIHEIGALNTLKAFHSFGFPYFSDTYKQNREFVQTHSPFMGERINTIDRDFVRGLSLDVGQGVGEMQGKAIHMRDTINRWGYWFLSETDLMCSLPLWKYQYDKTVNELMEKGTYDKDTIHDRAVYEADKAVRNVLGSAMVKDQPEVLRNKGIISAVTAFYSYSNTQINALIHAGYEWRKGNRMAMISAVLYWQVLATLLETVYRSAVAGDTMNEFANRLKVRFVANLTQGIPFVRDFAESGMNYLQGMKNFDSTTLLGLRSFGDINKVIGAYESGKDLTDIGRNTSRAINPYIKFPDTLSDGLWDLMRFSLYDTDRSMRELLTSIVFDKRYRTAEERQRAEKRKEKNK